MAALHDLDIKAAEVLNTYRMALNIEKISTGMMLSANIDQGLYSLKSAGAS